MTKKIINQLKRNGFFVIPNFVSKVDCKKYEKILDKLEKKRKKNGFKFYNSVSRGQVVLRDLICHDLKFLDVISKKKILKLVFSIFEDQFIIDGVTGSRPIKTSKNIQNHTLTHLAVNEFKNTLDIVLQLCVNDFNKKWCNIFLEKKSFIRKKMSNT